LKFDAPETIYIGQSIELQHNINVVMIKNVATKLFTILIPLSIYAHGDRLIALRVVSLHFPKALTKFDYHLPLSTKAV